MASTGSGFHIVCLGHGFLTSAKANAGVQERAAVTRGAPETFAADFNVLKATSSTMNDAGRDLCTLP